ncbi:MAG: 1-acyl-sn-glycerol-3-phosphate acyltransferase [Anaerolineales bacterium]|nr:1-acyl-sn-glycerol-3-phosphate acyltransferase [Anaerolineales bacterium]
MAQPSKIYPPLFPDITDWPIYQLYRDREGFVREIDDQASANIIERFGEDLSKVIARTAYLELIRLKETPWKSDPPNERQFWKRVRRELLENGRHREDVRNERNQELLRRIVHRYSEEIAGNFHQKTFKFARKFLTAFFKRLLNTAAGRNHRRIWGSKHHLYERLKVYGDVERIRNCFAQGTVVIVPTHFSNLDSVVIGYALDTIAGLPSFSYGAGLNLYNSEMAAYYMSRLGAYRVDRRKRNHIYLETLKTMSNLSLQRGVNSLFFPGGTRSRSGALESEVKMGLLGSLVEAQRSIFTQDKNNKIIIVPLVLSYHFVLEARMLIDQFLERAGEEKYLLMPDEFQSVRKILRFAWQFFSQSSDITLSFGAPMDVMGNRINESGESIDERGNLMSIREYFMHDGVISKNKQREAVYTRHLGKKIVESYKRDNVVLSSHIIAFAAFQQLKHLNPEFDLFGLIRLPNDEFVFDRTLLLDVVAQVFAHIRALAQSDQVKLPDEIKTMSPAALLADGMQNLGIYHVDNPLTTNKQGELISKSFKLLYFYHNRLSGYELEAAIRWNEELVIQALELADL